ATTALFATSSLVWIEPAPFDLLLIGFLAVLLARGLRVPRAHSLLILVFSVLAITGVVAATISAALVDSFRHVAISIFLFLGAIGLAAFYTSRGEWALRATLVGMTIAASIATVAGIAGYFSLVDGAYDLFTERDRARGTFKDPNVFGPFLVVPLVFLLVDRITGHARWVSVGTAAAALLAFGVLLSFSRGAWFNLALAVAITAYCLAVASHGARDRMKIVAVVGLALCALAGGFIVAMQFDAVAQMFSIRGQLLQSYDLNQRFVGMQLALGLILEQPLGIGAAAFREIHGTEPHNVYIYNFLIGGWLGGLAWIVLMVATMAVGMRAAITPSALRPYAVIFFSTFVANAIEGFIVDTDHWRHLYVQIAALWGIHCAINGMDVRVSGSRRRGRTNDHGVVTGSAGSGAAGNGAAGAVTGKRRRPATVGPLAPRNVLQNRMMRRRRMRVRPVRKEPRPDAPATRSTNNPAFDEREAAALRMTLEPLRQDRHIDSAEENEMDLRVIEPREAPMGDADPVADRSEEVADALTTPADDAALSKGRNIPVRRSLSAKDFLHDAPTPAERTSTPVPGDTPRDVISFGKRAERPDRQVFGRRAGSRTSARFSKK
ncbi:MAG: hypothetical protein AAFQ35_12030, partial [Pseudomonadota bacterium]